MGRSVQTLRGLACLLLVIYHVIGSTPQYGLQIPSGPLRELCDALAVVRALLFALLAGVASGWFPRASLGAWKARARRLLLPMLTVGTLFGVVRAGTAGTNATPVDWTLIHILPVGHDWFLESLFVLQTVVMLLELTGLLRRVAGWSTAFGAATIAYLAWPEPVWLGIAGALNLAPYFLLGTALVRYRTDVELRHDLPTGLLLLAAAAVMTRFWLQPSPRQDRFTLAMLVTGLLASYGLWLAKFHVAAGLVLGTATGVAGPILLKVRIDRRPWARLLLFGVGIRSARLNLASASIGQRAPSHGGSSA